MLGCREGSGRVLGTLNNDTSVGDFQDVLCSLERSGIDESMRWTTRICHPRGGIAVVFTREKAARKEKAVQRESNVSLFS